MRHHHLLTVLRLVNSPTADPLGPVDLDAAGNWSSYCQLRAMRQPVNATPASDPAQDSGLVKLRHVFHTRHNATAASIRVVDRIVWQGRLCHVAAVTDHDDRLRRSLAIHADEIVGAVPPPYLVAAAPGSIVLPRGTTHETQAISLVADTPLTVTAQNLSAVVDCQIARQISGTWQTITEAVDVRISQTNPAQVTITSGTSLSDCRAVLIG